MIMAEKIFKKNINVVLNEGDEVFFGYHDHFLYFLFIINKKRKIQI